LPSDARNDLASLQMAVFSDETISVRRRSEPETIVDQAFQQVIRQWSSIMWAIISSVYRAYCLARLLEMRRHHRVSHA
jgi:hypothetical protein